MSEPITLYKTSKRSPFRRRLSTVDFGGFRKGQRREHKSEVFPDGEFVIIVFKNGRNSWEIEFSREGYEAFKNFVQRGALV